MSDSIQYFGNRVEERKIFTPEERQRILHRTGCICATCGKRLTTKSMTVEHVIPISRGGTNDMKNLLPLCYGCNQRKGNLFYIGPDYYTAVKNTKLNHELWSICKDWFIQNKKSFNIKRYPLISPCTTIELTMSVSSKTILLSNLLDVHYVTHSEYSTVEAVSGLTLNSESVYYIVKRRTTDKLLLLLRIDNSNGVITLVTEWWDTESKKILSKILWNILLATMWRHNEFDMVIQGGAICSNDESLVRFLWGDCLMASSQGYTVQEWEYPNAEYKYCIIARKSFKQIVTSRCTK